MMISELENHEIIARSESCCTAGGAMTDAEAQRMRGVVGTSEWSDHNTKDIPEAEWLRMLTEACDFDPAAANLDQLNDALHAAGHETEYDCEHKARAALQTVLAEADQSVEPIGDGFYESADGTVIAEGDGSAVYPNYRDKDGYEMARMNQQDIDDAPTQKRKATA
jgi:hypothetical protein